MSRNVTDLKLEVKELAIKFLDEVERQLRVKLVITHTLRTWEEQAALYAKGRTAPGEIVTNARPGFSWHNFGRAFDVAILEGKSGLTWEGPWEEIGKVGEELGLVWGGRFKKLADRCHFEWHGGESLASLREQHEELLARKGGVERLQYYA